jgi:hypothetical protein
MNGLLALPLLHGPGWHWVPRVLRQRAYWAVVGRFALFGPLIGGLPYVWMLITIPGAYVFGLAPATVAGLLYAAWLLAASVRRPTALWRATVGAVCGAAGCAAVALAVSPAQPAFTVLLLGAHGVPAAIALALATGRAGQRHEGTQRTMASSGRGGPQIESDEPRSEAGSFSVDREHTRTVRFFSGG